MRVYLKRRSDNDFVSERCTDSGALTLNSSLLSDIELNVIKGNHSDGGYTESIKNLGVSVDSVSSRRLGLG